MEKELIQKMLENVGYILETNGFHTIINSYDQLLIEGVARLCVLDLLTDYTELIPLFGSAAKVLEDNKVPVLTSSTSCVLRNKVDEEGMILELVTLVDALDSIDVDYPIMFCRYGNDGHTLHLEFLNKAVVNIIGTSKIPSSYQDPEFRR